MLPWRRFAAGLLLAAGVFGARAEGTNSPPTPGRTEKQKPSFAVRSYAVEGNTVLPPAKIDAALSPHTGLKVDLDELLKAAGALQLLYRNAGFATVAVSIPRQQLTNGVVQLRVTEGRLGRITISGNRHFSSNNVARALPGLRTNVLLNTHWVQPELDRANANPDRQIYPVLSPGDEPGTTALELRVKDRLPLHGHIEINNISTPNTPPFRIDTSVQYNNLWQLNQQAGLEYNFSPLYSKSGDYEPRFFDQPQVASYSGYYRIPLGPAESVRSSFDNAPLDFGYDPVTHIFRAPAASGSPELTLFSTRSFSETPVRYGPFTVITNTPLADISSQSAERDLIASESFGSKVILPLREFSGVRSLLSIGVELKNFQTQNFSTNLTYFQLYALDQFGNRVLEGSQTIPLPSVTSYSLTYAPIELGWSGSRPDAHGVSAFSLGQNIFLPPLESARSGFQEAAGSVRAGGFFTTVNALVSREQTLPGGWSASLKANGQYASEPLIANEQFALGGAAGVRGYEDGEEYGDSGWQTQFDVRAPPLVAGHLPDRAGAIPVRVRLSWFMDYGENWHMDTSVAESKTDQWGTGVSFFTTAGEHFDARFTLAWALLDTALSKAGGARAYFRVGFQF